MRRLSAIAEKWPSKGTIQYDMIWLIVKWAKYRQWIIGGTLYLILVHLLGFTVLELSIPVVVIVKSLILFYITFFFYLRRISRRTGAQEK